MELIYTDASLVEQGYLKGFDLDMENGTENDFEMTTDISKYEVLKENYCIYVEDESNFGGKITALMPNTENSTLKYYGLTWRGLLTRQIIRPTTGQAYRSYTNKSTSYIINDILTATGLDEFFSVSETSDSISYQFDRYCTVYDGIVKMLKDNGQKLLCKFTGTGVLLTAAAAVDHSADDYSSEQFDFAAKKDYAPVNHVIGLGSGELAGRDVYDAYLQADGTAGTTRYYTEEVVAVLDVSGSESHDELIKATNEALLSYQATSSIDITIRDISVDIGDTVSGREEITGISVTKPIKNKILKMSDTDYTITYVTGE
jgi:hypothetical protein